jgi:hypothetical protein
VRCSPVMREREADIADLAADEIAVGQRSHTDGDIEAFANDIDETIFDPEFQADFGVAIQEGGRPGRDDSASVHLFLMIDSGTRYSLTSSIWSEPKRTFAKTSRSACVDSGSGSPAGGMTRT